MALAVVGDIDEETVRRLADKHFAGLPKCTQHRSTS